MPQAEITSGLSQYEGAWHTWWYAWASAERVPNTYREGPNRLFRWWAALDERRLRRQVARHLGQ